MLNAAIVGLGWWGKTLVESVQGSSDRPPHSTDPGPPPGPATPHDASREHRAPGAADPSGDEGGADPDPADGFARSE